MHRLLVIGLDGGTFDVLAPLAASGVMPNLAALMRSSALAQLRSTQPAITPTAWSTFLTGHDPQSHGIFDYRWLDTTGTLRLNRAERIARPTLFDWVADAGGDVASINLPMTAPRADGRGIIVGGLDMASAEIALAPYPALKTRLADRGIELSLRTHWTRRPQSFEELSAGVAATERDFLSRSAAAVEADRLLDWRMMVVQFQTFDCLQHRLWHLFDFAGGGGPRPWIEQVHQAFRVLDRAIGELVELAERRGAGLLLVSDHGFGPFREKISVPELLRRRGLSFAQTTGQRVAYRMARSWLKVRKWSGRRLSRAASAAGVRRSLAALLPLDWRRSVAFSAHGNLGALVYLNSVARFGAGPVRFAGEADQTAADVVAALSEARHPETEEPLFVDVFRTADRYGIDPIDHNAPDVIGIPADGFHTRHKFDCSARLMRTDPDLTGTHRRDGVLVAQLPGAITGTHHTAELRDVAPTILRWLNVAGGESMQGRVLDELTHDVPSTPRGCLGSSKASPRAMATQASADSNAEALVMARLRDLGYID